MLAEPFRVAVAEGLGAEMLDTSPEVLESHGRDWTRVYEPNASAVAFPRTTQDVSTLLNTREARASMDKVCSRPARGRVYSRCHQASVNMCLTCAGFATLNVSMRAKPSVATVPRMREPVWRRPGVAVEVWSVRT